MPNKKSMENLKNGTRFTTENAKEKGRKGGRKSVEARRLYKDFKECFSNKITDEDRDQMFEMLKKRAKSGNLKAFEILRDTLGEKPVEHIEQTSTDVVINLNGWEEDED